LGGEVVIQVAFSSVLFVEIWGVTPNGNNRKVLKFNWGENTKACGVKKD